MRLRVAEGNPFYSLLSNTDSISPPSPYLSSGGAPLLPTQLSTYTPYMFSPLPPFLLLPSPLPGMYFPSSFSHPSRLICLHLQEAFPDPEVTALPSGPPQGLSSLSVLANSNQWTYSPHAPSQPVFCFWTRVYFLRLSTPVDSRTFMSSSASYLFTGPATHPWSWAQGPYDSWPGLRGSLCRGRTRWPGTVRGIGQRPGVAAGSQEVRLNHPLKLLVATHSVDAWHEVELLRDKTWRARDKVCED